MIDVDRKKGCCFDWYLSNVCVVYLYNFFGVLILEF